MQRRLAILAFLLAFGGCGSDADTLGIGDEESGNEVSLETGQRLEIRLESNPSTGFRWRVESTIDVLESVSDSYEPPSDDAIGGSGVEVLVFEATRAGAAILRLEYVRDFDQPVVPVRVVEYIIRVDGAEWTRPTGQPPDTAADSAPSTSPDGAVDVSVLLADPQPGFVLVSGFIVWDDSGARLCEVLLESFPPQCGGQSIGFVDPVQLDPEFELEETMGVRWTIRPVVLGGVFDGKRLTLLDQTTADD